jgi:hypothetical protein
MAIRLERFCNGNHALNDVTLRGKTPYEVKRRSGEVRGKPLNAGSAGPFVVEILEEGR